MPFHSGLYLWERSCNSLPSFHPPLHISIHNPCLPSPSSLNYSLLFPPFFHTPPNETISLPSFTLYPILQFTYLGRFTFNFTPIHPVPPESCNISPIHMFSSYTLHNLCMGIIFPGAIYCCLFSPCLSFSFPALGGAALTCIFLLADLLAAFPGDLHLQTLSIFLSPGHTDPLATNSSALSSPIFLFLFFLLPFPLKIHTPPLMHVGSSSSCQIYSVVSKRVLLLFRPFIYGRCLANLYPPSTHPSIYPYTTLVSLSLYL